MVHDDAADAIAQISLTADVRASLPPDLVEELDKLAEEGGPPGYAATGNGRDG
jgi:hypothetical protein